MDRLMKGNIFIDFLKLLAVIFLTLHFFFWAANSAFGQITGVQQVDFEIADTSGQLAVFNFAEWKPGQGQWQSSVNGYFLQAHRHPDGYIKYLDLDPYVRTDSVGSGADADSSGCITAAGDSTRIVFDDLTGVTIDTSYGTASTTISGDSILLGAGTCWNIRLLKAGVSWAILACEEGSGATLFDITGNGNDGTLTGFLPPGPAVDSAWVNKRAGDPNHNRSYGFLQGSSTAVTDGGVEDTIPYIGGSQLIGTRGAIEQSNTQKHGGSYSLKYTGDGSGEGAHQIYAPWISHNLAGTGAHYTYSCWVYIPSGNSEITKVKISFYDSSWTHGEYSSTTDAWEKITLDVKLSQSTTYGTIASDKSSGTTSESFYVDDIAWTLVKTPADVSRPVYSADGYYLSNPAYDWQSTTLFRNLADDQTGAIACWIKVPAAATDSFTIFSVGDASENTYMRARYISGKIRAELVSAGTSKWSAITDNEVIEDDTWYSITLNHNGQTPRIWVGSATEEPKIPPQTLTESDQGYWLGDMSGLDNALIGASRNNGEYKDKGEFWIALFEAWSRAMTSEEIHDRRPPLLTTGVK